MDTHYTLHGPLILAIHPRIPFTNIGIFRSQQMLFLKKVMHPDEERKDFKNYSDETSYRAKKIIEEIRENDIPINDIKIIITRGGLIRPLGAGVYRINESMLDDLKSGLQGEDVVNLGGLIAAEIAGQLKQAEAYAADPVVVDEFDEIARVTGHPDLQRRSVFHALEQKAVARKYAKTLLKKYEDLNLIVAQLGNGITVGAHKKGKVIDANQGLDGDGPFSPTRTGGLPVGDLVKLCFSGKYTEEEVMRMITIDGGLYAYLGTHDGYTADAKARSGDQEAIFYLRAMAYQVAKTVGSMCAVLSSEVDAILLTGGLTHSKFFMEELQSRIKNIAPVHTYSNEDDVETLALNGYYILQGELEPQDYKPE